MLKVYIGSDHAGFALKEALKLFVEDLGYVAEDVGAATFVEDDDYPESATACAQKVAAHKGSFGIIIGGSGEGEAMAANRVKGIRAAVYYGEAARPQTDTGGTTLDIISSSRVHNDANVLSLGARFITEDEAKEAVRRFLETAFGGEERHRRRIEKLG